MTRKKVIKMLTVIIVLGGIHATAMLGLIVYGTKYRPTQNADTVLILGAEVRGNSAKNAYPSPVLKERLDGALAYIDKAPQAKVIVCGGQGPDEPISEAKCMADYLKANGVPSNRLLLENKSSRTQENIKNAQKLTPLKKVVIVTSDFHAFRAKLLAKRAGIQRVSIAPTPSKTNITLNMYGREIFALGKGIIFDW